MTQAAPSQRYRHTFPLSSLLIRTAGIMADLGPQFLHYSQKFADLTDRHSRGRFHLAVLGQFKRGKSTFLNALTGESILPVGVVPLTDDVKRRSLKFIDAEANCLANSMAALKTIQADLAGLISDRSDTRSPT